MKNIKTAMEIMDALNVLENDGAFKEWKESNADSFMAHAFTMVEGDHDGNYQFGFYNKDDTMTSFDAGPSGVVQGASDEIFKKPEATIKPLLREEIAIPFVKALYLAEKTQATEFSSENPLKIMVVLQNLPEHGTVYNITYITQALKALNMRISSVDGAVLKKQLTALTDFKTE
ncbi:MAG: hypothetical protein O2779_05720 [Nanoarchaeota archaeon]|nr:hypothetical protein [Nanoarchaeota archaeon]